MEQNFQPCTTHPQSELSVHTDCACPQAPHLFLQVCSVTCCGIINFEQHCTSKKHLRKAAAVAHAAVSTNSLFLAGSDATPTASTASDGGTGTTYVGIKAQCRTYCKQVCNFEPLRHTPQYLQQQALKAFCKVTAGHCLCVSCHATTQTAILLLDMYIYIFTWNLNIYVYIYVCIDMYIYMYVDAGHVASYVKSQTRSYADV